MESRAHENMGNLKYLPNIHQTTFIDKMLMS